jgi:hypothetical protein
MDDVMDGAQVCTAARENIWTFPGLSRQRASSLGLVEALA